MGEGLGVASSLENAGKFRWRRIKTPRTSLTISIQYVFNNLQMSQRFVLSLASNFLDPSQNTLLGLYRLKDWLVFSVAL